MHMPHETPICAVLILNYPLHACMYVVWPGVLKTRAVPIRIPKLDRYSKALSGPANNHVILQPAGCRRPHEQTVKPWMQFDQRTTE
jgi:hypothetical protein